jgi:PAS domain S-box-containing protein
MNEPTPPKPTELPVLTGDELTARRLAAIVESSDDAIVSKNLDGIVQTWNRGAERMFGWTSAEMVGRSIRTIIPRDRQHEEDEVLRRIRAGQSIEHYETIRTRKDGSLLDISLSVSPIHASDGRVVGVSKIARDVTERKRLLSELERASRQKDEFLATLSHELRTPLNAVLGYVHMLRQPGIGPEQRARAEEAIERNGRVLTRLVSDIFDISTIAAGKTRLRLRESDIVAVLDASLDVVRPAAAAKGVELVRDVDPLQIHLLVDADRLQQVFWNVLANALKYTPRGGRITARMRIVEDEVRIVVEDTGAGIERSLLPYVFQRFRQGNIAPAGDGRGLGLGLALVRHFVELHGGTVKADSEGPGRGARFEVALPSAAARAPV